MTATTAPVVLRARITAGEYHALKIRAAQHETTVADLVADALRAAYPLTNGTK